MEKPQPKDFSKVSETLFYTLYMRARESQRPDGLIHDLKAVEIVERIEFDFKRFRFHNHDQVAPILRMRQYDRLAGAFLAQHPTATVVHIGCGLDTRFERVDNGSVTWYDLDLAPVIELRRQLITEQLRCCMLACSVLDFSWMNMIQIAPGQPVLFLAEGVFIYLQPEEVKNLVLTMRERFAGCELGFDASLPWVMRSRNTQLKFVHSPLRVTWSIPNPHELENWADGIRLLDEWNYYQERERRLGWVNFFGHFSAVARSAWVLHYRLG